MIRLKELFLYITIICWGTILGGMLYSHIVYFPPYLSHLPESTALLTAPYGLHDEHFWMLMHPLTILSLLITLILNWKLTDRRKFILVSTGIYALAIISTAAFFVPELMAFAESAHSNIPASEWLQRGQTWQHFSWVRGGFMYLGFVMLLIGLQKKSEPITRSK